MMNTTKKADTVTLDMYYGTSDLSIREMLENTQNMLSDKVEYFWVEPAVGDVETFRASQGSTLKTLGAVKDYDLPAGIKLSEARLFLTDAALHIFPKNGATAFCLYYETSRNSTPPAKALLKACGNPDNCDLKYTAAYRDETVFGQWAQSPAEMTIRTYLDPETFTPFQWRMINATN